MLKMQVRSPAAPVPAAVAVFDEHGGALLALASVMVRDQMPAETAVVEVISAAFPATAMAVPMPAAEVRRELARRTYRRCSRADQATERDQQRIALALTHCGQLTYRQVADLLRLTAADAAQLLSSGLRLHLN
jgi:hypothetical protein